MRKIYCAITALLLAVLSTNLSYATSGSQGSSSDDHKGSKIILYPEKPAKRPNAPARFFMECTYQDNQLLFSLPVNIEAANISITGSNTSITSQRISHTNPCIQFSPELGGEYLIEARTEGGAVYRGVLSI